MTMTAETKQCQNCKSQFTVEPEDFAFYEKIGVLLPALCPLCRAQKRLAFRNERVFYKRPCDRCKKNVVSMYSPNKSYIVWCYDCWFSDDWDAADFGALYDPTKPFFEQFQGLWQKVPKISLIHVRSVNSEYINISADNKDCYMIIESSNNEACTHCYWIQQCRDCVDVSFSSQTELSYESNDCYDSYKLLYSKGCHDCRDGYFLLDCRGCSNCIGCVNLRNKQYHIFNKPVSKSEYEQFMAHAHLDTHTGVEALRSKCAAFFARQPRKYGEIVNAPGSTGNYIKNAKNSKACFHCYDAEDNKYGVHIWRDAKDCVDCDTAGRTAHHMYNSMNAGIETSNYICSCLCWTCSFMWYSYYCFNCENCFGCVGLRKKKYCILNTQYSREEFNQIKNTIIADMKRRNEYGEFFPAALSTFGYNESAAQEQFPLTKQQALNLGFNWEDNKSGTYGKETVLWEAVPDSIQEAGDIGNEIFACAECKKNFRIIPSEFLFYQKLNIPLPRLCPDCRHAHRFSARGPNRLWPRTCQCAGAKSENGAYENSIQHFHASDKCPNGFQTPYAPDRPEIVYCEACYNTEMA